MKKYLAVFLFCLVTINLKAQRLNLSAGFSKETGLILFDDLYTYQWPTISYQFNQANINGLFLNLYAEYCFQNNFEFYTKYDFGGYKLRLNSDDQPIFFPDKTEASNTDKRELIYSKIENGVSLSLLNGKRFNLELFTGIKFSILHQARSTKKTETNYQEWLPGDDSSYSYINETSVHFNHDFKVNHFLKTKPLLGYTLGFGANFQNASMQFRYTGNIGDLQKNHLFGSYNGLEISMFYNFKSIPAVQYNKNKIQKETTKHSPRTFLSSSTMNFYAGLSYRFLNLLQLYPSGTYVFGNDQTNFGAGDYGYYCFTIEDIPKIRTYPNFAIGLEFPISSRITLTGEINLSVQRFIFHKENYTTTNQSSLVYYLDHLSSDPEEYITSLFAQTSIKPSVLLEVIQFRQFSVYLKPAFSYDRIAGDDFFLPRPRNFSFYSAVGISRNKFSVECEYGQSLFNYSIDNSVLPSTSQKVLSLGIKIPIYRF